MDTKTAEAICGWICFFIVAVGLIIGMSILVTNPPQDDHWDLPPTQPPPLFLVGVMRIRIESNTIGGQFGMAEVWVKGPSGFDDWLSYRGVAAIESDDDDDDYVGFAVDKNYNTDFRVAVTRETPKNWTLTFGEITDVHAIHIFASRQTLLPQPVTTNGARLIIYTHNNSIALDTILIGPCEQIFNAYESATFLVGYSGDCING